MSDSKKVLLFAPVFYGYNKLIEAEMKREGYEVDSISFPGSKIKRVVFYIKLLQAISEKIVSHKYKTILKRILSKKYDFVVVIKSSELPVFFLEELKEHFVNSVFVLYVWDDIDLDKEELLRLKYFDKTFSYSLRDSKTYNMKFRPMFFVDYGYKLNEKNIDLFYIGSYRHNRFDFIYKVLTAIGTKNYRVILRCSPILMFSRAVNLKKITWFSLTGVSYCKMMKIMSKSKICVELCRPGQKSLSTRPFEAMATQCKLITTNTEIVNYDFFHDNNICIVNEENPHISKEWLGKPFIPITSEILNKYSVRAFVSDLLNL